MTPDLQADPSGLVALFLFSLAVRPLPAELADADADAFQLNRADVWRLAEAAGLRPIVSRTRFHAVTVALSGETDAVTEDRIVGGSRRFIRLVLPSSDAYVWTEEALADLEAEDLDVLTAAAVSHGFDVSTPLPAALVSPVCQGADERKAQQAAEIKAAALDEENDDQADEDAPVPDRACTKCTRVQPLTEFPTRTNGRPSSWCSACHRAASAAWWRTHRDYSRTGGLVGTNGEDLDTHTAYSYRSEAEIWAAMPRHKHCRRCREVKDSAAFNRDNHKRDGLSVYCRTCRSNERVREATRALIDPPAPLPR